jgi:anaerobic ribonucleoside-triphosphate reductase activating protein
MKSVKTPDKIRVAGIVKNSIVDGPGIRYTIFSQGCPIKCEGCHNPQTHDPDGGELVEISTMADEIKRDPLLGGVTFTGGEPFVQVREFAALADLIKNHIICYTGYSFEELYENSDNHILLSKIDVLVDGRFKESEKSTDIKFKGSKNQRTLDSKESVKCGKAIKISL